MSKSPGLRYWIIISTASFLLSILFIAYFGEFFKLKPFHFEKDNIKSHWVFINKWNTKLQKERLYLIKKRNINFVARCIALPGDTFQIKNGKFYINNKQFYPKHIQYFYEFISEQSIRDSLNKYNVVFNETNAQGLFISIAILALGYQTYFASIKGVYSTKRQNRSFENESNIDFFGPVIMPKKNQKIKFDSNLIDFYAPLESEKIIQISNTEYEFTARQNYYFFLNDIQNVVLDSRNLGPIKESDVVGLIKKHFEFN
jgi:signal peptidase I